MAGSRIRGITIEINGDATGLNKALNDVNKSIKNTQSQLKDLGKVLEFNPGSTDLLTQKQKALANEVEKTRQKLATEKEALRQLQEGAQNDETVRQQENLQREIAETEQKLKDAEQAFKEFGSVGAQQTAAAGEKFQKFGTKLQSVGGTLSKTVTAPLAGIGAASIKAASDFESSFAKLSTIADTSGKTGVSVDKLRSQIMDLSNQSGMSASAIAEAAYQAISAGQSTGDALQFVAQSSKLAKAGFTDVSTATDTLTTIMNSYGKAAGPALSISNKLLTVQNLGKTTIDELGASIGKVIPTAAMYGVSLDQLSAAYITTTKNGIATAESTTYINSMLNELGKTGSTASDALKAKTGKTLQELMQSGMSLTDVLGILQESASETGGSIADMFGSQEAGKAAATLLQHTDDFNNGLKSVEDSAKTTEKAVGKLGKTSAAQLNKVKTQLQNDLITIGESLITTLGPAFHDIAKVISDLGEKFQSLSPKQQDFVVKLGLIAAATGPVIGGLGKLSWSIGEIMKRAPNMSAALSGLKDFGGLAKSEGLLAALGKTKGFSAITGMATKLSGVIGTIGKGLGGLMGTLGGMPPTLLPIIAAVGAAIAIGVLLYKNWDTIKAKAGELKGKLSEVFGNVKGTAKGAFDSMISAGKTALEGIKGALSTVGAILAPAGQVILTAVTGIFSGIQQVLSGAWEVLKNAVLGAVLVLIDLITGNFQQIPSDIMGIFGNIASGLGQIFSGIVQIFSSYFQGIVGVIQTVGGMIKSGFIAIVTGMVSAAKSFLSSLVSAFKSGFSSALSTVKSIGGSMKTAFVNAIQALVSGAKAKISQVPGIIKSGMKGAVDYLKGLPKQALKWGKDFMKGFADGVKSKIGSIVSSVKGLAGKIRGYLHFSRPDVGPLRDYEKWMPDFMEGLAKGIRSNTWRVTDALNIASASMQPAFAGRAAAVSNTSYSYGNMSITVNSSEGQSPQAIARAVKAEINKELRARKAVRK